MAFNEEETRFHLIDPVLRRKGYDDRGWVVCQAPEHVVENKQAMARAAWRMAWLAPTDSM